MSKCKECIILNGIIPFADLKFGTRLSSSYREVRKMSGWTPAEITTWQIRNMRHRIEHAYAHIPYYKRLLNELSLTPTDFTTLSDLQKLPALTKDIIRSHYADLIPDDVKHFSYHNGATGGSTGTPVRYLCDNRSWSMANAFNILQRHKTGYYYGDKFIGMGGSSIGTAITHSLVHRLYYRLIGKCAMGSPGINKQELQHYVEFIVKNNIKYIYGYASVIFLFAKYVIASGFQDRMNIKGVFPSCDILLPHYAETINNAFKGCRILDSYGAFDGCVSGYRCLWLDNGFFCGYGTYIETDNSIAEGYGRILITDLIGYAFPFIRYDLGDVVEIDADKSYSSIFNGQVLKSVQGRISNLIKLKSGYYISEASLHNAFKDVHIDGYKVEVKDNDIIVTVVPSAGYNENEEFEIKKIIGDRTGHVYNIIINHSSVIERRKNGKSLFIMTNTPID